jgi:fructosamine-3-kinase
MAMVSPGTFHFSICCRTKPSNSGFNGELAHLSTMLNSRRAGSCWKGGNFRDKNHLVLNSLTGEPSESDVVLLCTLLRTYLNTYGDIKKNMVSCDSL